MQQKSKEEIPYLVTYDARDDLVPNVSVLLPVYQVEQFLRPCIESLVHQTIKKIELIFVCDKSQDHSLDILLEYAEYDRRIVIAEGVRKGGMARARNIGISLARGKYLAFVDSDDICDVTMFEKMYQKAENLNADIVTCGVWSFNDTPDAKFLRHPLEWHENSDRLLSITGRPQLLMEPAAWAKLFRTEYVKGLDFFEFRPDTVAWEDTPAMTNAFVQTEKIATVQEALYYYRQRLEGNLSSGMTRCYVDQFFSGVEAQAQILAKYGPDDFVFCSYIEEFKLNYSQWMLSRLGPKDALYFLHNTGKIFKKEDRKYLAEVFAREPGKRKFYSILKMHSYLIYRIGKFLFGKFKIVKNFVCRSA